MLESEVQRLAIHPINKSVFAIGEMRIDTYDDVRMITPSLLTHLAGKV
jgi:chromosome transmission fidelity protein 4